MMDKSFNLSDKSFKQIYAFVLLAVTVGWAVFAVLLVRSSMASPTPVNVLEASGASVLLGALITQTHDVKQYFFRKRPGDSDTKPPVA